MSLNCSSTIVTPYCASLYGGGIDFTTPGFVLPVGGQAKALETYFYAMTITQGTSQNCSGFYDIFNYHPYAAFELFEGCYLFGQMNPPTFANTSEMVQNQLKELQSLGAPYIVMNGQQYALEQQSSAGRVQAGGTIVAAIVAVVLSLVLL